MDAKNEDAIRGLIEAGSNIVGGATGGAVGFLVGGPVGAAVGGAAGAALPQVFSKVGVELKQRLLGKREEMRIGAVFICAAKKIQVKLDEGQRLRNDGFFDEDDTGRSNADEICEGVFLSAQKEHEEKKLKYYGNLLANIAFNHEIDKAQANMMIKIADDLTYRQLCLIYIFFNKDNYKYNLSNNFSWTDSHPTPKGRMVSQEIFDMYSKGLVKCKDSGIYNTDNLVIPAKMRLTGGSLLYMLMELGDIERNDIDVVLPYLLSK